MDSEKNALIVGASYGLGRAVSIGLAQAGYNVILLARGKAGLHETRELLGSAKRVLVIEADISKTSDVEETVATITQHFDRLHLVWHGASPFSADTLENVSVEMLHAFADITFFGTLLLTKKLIPLLKGANGARIFIANTTWALPNAIGPSPFSSAKYALIGLQQGLNNELKRFNIYTTTLYIGQVRSRESVNDEASLVLGEADLIQSSEIVETVIFIAGLRTAYVPSIVLRDSSSPWRYSTDLGEWTKET
ncbi:MAG: SDR family oxidoreductase [Chloroflexi bacterium]|nr:SDR family oxidoreductase [Chloroflexota bacterium]